MNLLYRIRRKVFLLSFHFSGNKRPSSAPYISGDTFRAFADYIYDETSTLDPQEVREGRTVFVKSDMLDDFFAKIHPHISFPYVLISHNSDRNIVESDIIKIDDKIIHWFAQNVLVNHPKITPIPIGIENAHYHMHGVTKVFDSLRKKTTDRNSRILFGFNIKTNPAEREHAFNTLIHLPTAHAIKGWIAPRKYLELLRAYGFVASPPGNGVDCHRTWEALYLKTIPIVKRSIGVESFESLGLPIWIINNWDELLEYTEDELQERYTHMQQRADTKALTTDYWKEKIRESKL